MLTDKSLKKAKDKLCEKLGCGWATPVNKKLKFAKNDLLSLGIHETARIMEDISKGKGKEVSFFNLPWGNCKKF